MRLIRAFGRDRRGAAAVEFAFVAGPFLLMLFAVIELALYFLMSTSLDAAADRTARRLRTGEVQTAAETVTQFEKGICGRMTWLAGNCETNLTVDVRTYTSFSGITDPLLTDSTTKTGKKTFDPGSAQFAGDAAPNTVVVVRSYYRHTLIAPFAGGGLARLDNSTTQALLTSTQVFRTEPYRPT